MGYLDKPRIALVSHGARPFSDAVDTGLFETSGPDFSKMRVLMVEDEPKDARLGQSVLGSMGFKAVIVVQNGRQALDVLQKYDDIQLIISDWNMPHISGIELLRAARKRWPGLPFVMLTSNDSVDHVRTARAAGVHAYVVKPYGSKDLQRGITSAIRRRLAEGGENADDSDNVYREALNVIDAVIDHSEGVAVAWKDRVEHGRFEASLERVLFPPDGAAPDHEELARAAETLKQTSTGDPDADRLLATIIDQLSEFVAKLRTPTLVQLEVIRLYVATTRAIVHNRQDHGPLNSKKLVEALGMAAKKAL